MVATAECRRLEQAQGDQCGEEIVLPRTAFDMLFLRERRVNKRGREGSRRVSSREPGMSTMNLGFVGSIVAEPFSCARIEVRRNDFRTIYGPFGVRTIIEHGDVWAWA